MQVSSPIEVAGCRVLIVEGEAELATDMAAWIQRRGGETVGPVATPEAAMTALEQGGRLNAVMVDVDLADGMALPLARRFWARGVAIIWVIGDDGYDFDANEGFGVYRLECDPENVVRLKWRRD